MPEVEIQYLAVIAAAMANVAIGAVWYSPFVFGRTWMAHSGLRPEDMKGKGRAMLISAAVALVTAFMLAYFFDLLDVQTPGAGISLAFRAWLGFAAAVMALDLGFGGKHFRVYLIDAGNQLAAFLAMGAILSIWR
ncbi:MAG TPA: DUF1761 domain-containing protein [Spirochaetota bacterium]|nr:DUF1761 domain-containing protein [Spirochaetota bacterium]